MMQNNQMSLGDEFEIIRAIQRTLGKPSKRVIVDIGDDSAVVTSPKGRLVTTVDTLVEGVHFDLAYTNPAELGHKALAVNLSDIAAMGAEPLYALVSLGMRQETSEYFVIGLYEGMKKLAKRHHVDVIGGNLSQSPTTLIVSVTLIGQTDKNYVTRSGARVGDIVAVTGDLGASAAGLVGLRRLGRDKLTFHPEIVRRHLLPEPRIKEARWLAQNGLASSLIDISDGLAADLHHVAKQSRVGMLLDQTAIPISPATVSAGELLDSNPNLWALYGGEDYELLITIPPAGFEKARRALKRLGTPLTKIGEVVSKAQGVRIRNKAGEIVLLEPRGWNHFVRRRRT
jgi:thiamine-monophosphate kinase